MLALTLVVYLPMIGGEFFSDDFVYVVGNTTLQETSLFKPWTFFVERTNPYEFLPVRDLSLRLDMAMFGLEPSGYKWHNLLLYLACGLAAWFACRELLVHFRRPGGETEAAPPEETAWVPVLVAALFLAHPAHVESVAWVSGRKDLLSGLCALLALGCFARAMRPRLAPGWLIGSHLLFVLAIMSKVTALATLPVILLLALTLPQRLRGLLAAAPSIVTAFAWWLVALGQGRATGVLLNPFMSEIIANHWFEAGPRILAVLTRIALAPIGMRLIYDLDRADWTTTVFGYLVLAVVIVAAVFVVRRRSAPAFGLAAFGIFCVPYLQLVPYSTWSLASERFLFLAIFGTSLALGTALARSGFRTLLAGAGLIAALGMALTFHQAGLWKDPSRLVEVSAGLVPGSIQTQRLYISGVLLPEGRYEEAQTAAESVRDPLGRAVLGRFVRARQAIDSGDWERARAEASGLGWLVDRDSDAYILMLMGQLAAAEGDEVEALRHFSHAERRSRTTSDMQAARSALRALREKHAGRLEAMRALAASAPGDVVAQGNLANAEMELFLLDEAISRYRGILDQRPDLAVARYNLGLALMRQGRFREAVGELRRAIDLGMGNPTAWNNLANALKQSGELQAAAGAYRNALTLDATHCHAGINLARLHLAWKEPLPARRALESVRSACADLEFLFEIYLEQADRQEQG